MGVFAFVLALGSSVDLLIRMDVGNGGGADGTMGINFMYMSLFRQSYLLYFHPLCAISITFTILPFLRLLSVVRDVGGADDLNSGVVSLSETFAK